MTSIKDLDAQVPDEPTPPAKPKKSPSPQNCRNFIRKQTANAMPDIVNTFVDKAKEGSVPHFTSLAKVGGFDQRSGAAEAPKRKRRSLARQLLDEVEKYEARQAAELAAANAAATQSDTPSPQEKS
jgi:hypothetical protein